MSTIIKDFTLGADPEFACEKNRTLIFAGDVLEDDDDTAEFGADGNGTTFEVRPAPSRNPLQIVNNIRDIFVRHTMDKPDFLKYKWVSATWHRGYPLGGHIHFGISANTLGPEDGVNTLDHYVGLISLLLEKKKDGVRRRRDGYGYMGDFREQEWGFEYRPMSCWLGSPYVAAAMLCLSKTVMYERINNPKFPWREYAQEDDYLLMRQDRIRAIFPEIWADITRMSLYQVYKPYIDLIYFLVKNRLTWFPRSSMKESWAIFDMKTCLTNKVGMDLIWHRYNNA